MDGTPFEDVDGVPIEDPNFDGVYIYLSIFSIQFSKLILYICNFFSRNLETFAHICFCGQKKELFTN